MICPRCKHHTMMLVLTNGGQMCRECKRRTGRLTQRQIDPEETIQDNPDYFVMGTLLLLFILTSITGLPAIGWRYVRTWLATAWSHLTLSVNCGWCRRSMKRAIIPTPRNHHNISGSVCPECQAKLKVNFHGSMATLNCNVRSTPPSRPNRFQSQLP